MKRRAVDSEYYFTIVLKDSGKVIGEVFSGPEGVDPENETLLKYSIADQYYFTLDRRISPAQMKRPPGDGGQH